MVKIVDVYDRKRHCGWRKPGGLYVTAPNLIEACGMLPLRLSECPCCGRAIKLTRGLQKIDVQRLFQDATCANVGEGCRMCLINRTREGYLIGVGSKFYRGRHDFIREAMQQGVSKRIAQLPRDLEVGRSVILVGHPKVFTDSMPERALYETPEIDDDADQSGLPLIDALSTTTGRVIVRDYPGVIALFVPERIEYVTTGEETEAFLEGLVRRGITPVRVIRVEDRQLELPHAH